MRYILSLLLISFVLISYIGFVSGEGINSFIGYFESGGVYYKFKDTLVFGRVSGVQPDEYGPGGFCYNGECYEGGYYNKVGDFNTGNLLKFYFYYNQSESNSHSFLYDVSTDGLAIVKNGSIDKELFGYSYGDVLDLGGLKKRVGMGLYKTKYGAFVYYARLGEIKVFKPTSNGYSAYGKIYFGNIVDSGSIISSMSGHTLNRNGNIYICNQSGCVVNGYSGDLVLDWAISLKYIYILNEDYIVIIPYYDGLGLVYYDNDGHKHGIGLHVFNFYVFYLRDYIENGGDIKNYLKEYYLDGSSYRFNIEFFGSPDYNIYTGYITSSGLVINNYLFDYDFANVRYNRDVYGNGFIQRGDNAHISVNLRYWNKTLGRGYLCFIPYKYGWSNPRWKGSHRCKLGTYVGGSSLVVSKSLLDGNNTGSNTGNTTTTTGSSDTGLGDTGSGQSLFVDYDYSGAEGSGNGLSTCPVEISDNKFAQILNFGFGGWSILGLHIPEVRPLKSFSCLVSIFDWYVNGGGYIGSLGFNMDLIRNDEPSKYLNVGVLKDVDIPIKLGDLLFLYLVLIVSYAIFFKKD